MITTHKSTKNLINKKYNKIKNDNNHFTALVEKIIINSEIRVDFNKNIKKEINIIECNLNKKEIKKRLDLRSLALCTIDSDQAKDLDDAVFAEKIDKNFRVIVAISDVSYYVEKNSKLDLEAYKRGTSVYYANKCIPMIPEKLSNGLCSLNPNEDRFCISVEMIICSNGTIKKTLINNAIMNSKAKLTYEIVQEIINNKKNIDISKKIKKSINAVNEISKILRKARNSRGALTFNTIENSIKFNKIGEPLSIKIEKRLESHLIIEDLMIITNEAVSIFIEKNKKNSIFRVHEEPDKENLKIFLNFAKKFGLLNDNFKKKLSKITFNLNKNKHSLILNMLLLRSMKQARYDTLNVGHFGLASKSYLHFTSPIRRYPDLEIHRIIKSILSADLKNTKKKNITAIAIHCSKQERKAISLERDLNSFYNTWLIRNKIGIKDKGIVTNCTNFGVFVRLKTHNIEGLIHIKKIPNFLIFDNNKKRLISKNSNFSIGLGDEVNIKISSVDVSKSFINFTLN